MTSSAWYPEMIPGGLMRALGQNWWLFLLEGVAAIVFGILTLVWPGITLLTLLIFFGAYALIDGIFALGAGIFGTSHVAPRWWLILVGIFGIIAGIGTFVWPAITGLTLLFFIAAWAIAIGVFQIVGAFQLRREIDNEWWLVLKGALSVLFGAALFTWPGAGALALAWLIGWYAIVFGILTAGFAFNVKKYKSRSRQA
jgi:uncharacterized membrane protein HdeD (DUF308 family)